MAKHSRVISFTPIMALATLLAVSLQLNGLLMMWKIHQAKQNDAIRAALFWKRNYSWRRLKRIKQRCLNRSIRTCWYKPGRTDSWWENIWTGTAPEECWKENFRMSRTSFVNLVAELRPYISPNPTSSTIKRMRCCEEFLPVTGMKCSYGKIFQPAYRDPGWKNRDLGNQAALSYEHIENFIKDLEVRRDLGMHSGRLGVTARTD